MDSESRLIGAIRENNIEGVRACLTQEPALVRSIIDRKRSGSALHLAAKFDSRNHSELTSVLLNEFDADPNIRNRGDSLPLYWALAESSKSASNSLRAIEALLKHRKLALHQPDTRTNPLQFIKTHYLGPPHGRRIRQFLQERLWEDKALALFVWARRRFHLA